MLSFKINEEEKNNLIQKYSKYSLNSNGEYILFRAEIDNTILTIYDNNKKNTFKGTITGNNLDEFILNNNIKIIEKKIKNTKEIKGFLCEKDQIGSDEVGFGDFFGPIIVVASFVNSNTIELIKEYGISDSKKLSDSKIKEIVPKIIAKVDYSLLIVDNKKLNELFSNKYNLNQIKSILHNSALNKVYNRHKTVDNVFIDEFTSMDNYYKYISNKENNIPFITFKTHGEESYPSVALSSCIARYYFLQKMEELSKLYNMEIPFGASKKVDDFAVEFKEKYGIEELKKIVKTNFKNYKKLL